MMGNKTTAKNAKGIIPMAMDKTKKMATKANDFALVKTEDVVTNSLEATAQWQHVADTALKGGLKLAANQQDLIFDVLNEIKAQMMVSKKRFAKLVN